MGPLVILLCILHVAHSGFHERMKSQHSEKLAKTGEMAKKLADLLEHAKKLNDNSVRPLLGLIDSVNEELTAIMESVESAMEGHMPTPSDSMALVKYQGPHHGHHHHHQGQAPLHHDHHKAAAASSSSSGSKEDDYKPVTFKELTDHLSYLGPSSGMLLRGLLVDGEGVINMDYYHHKSDKAYLIKKPVTAHSVVSLNLPTDGLSSVDLLEWFKTAKSYPLLETADIIKGIRRKFLGELEVWLKKSVTDGDRYEIQKKKDGYRKDVRDVLKYILNEVKQISSFSKPKIETYAEWIEAFIKRADVFINCINTDGSILDDEGVCPEAYNILPDNLYLNNTKYEKNNTGYYLYPEKEFTILVGQLINGQIKALIEKIDELGLVNNLRWDEGEKKVEIGKPSSHNEKSMLDKVLQKRQHKLEKHIDRVNRHYVKHVPSY